MKFPSFSWLLVSASALVLPAWSHAVAVYNVTTYTTTSAGTITQTAKDSANASGLSLTPDDDYRLGFRTFDSSLGTLNSVTFTMSSATVGGTIIFNSDGSSATVTGLTSSIFFYSDIFQEGEPTFPVAVASTFTSNLPVSPSQFSQVISQNSSQTYILNSTSLVSGSSPLTKTLTSFLQIQDFIGDGSLITSHDFIINSYISISGTLGGSSSTNTSGYNSDTTFSMTYNYTPTSPIPEPSTYGLLLGSLALGAVCNRRRKLKS